jgi:hypothetical protein
MRNAIGPGHPATCTLWPVSASMLEVELPGQVENELSVRLPMLATRPSVFERHQRFAARPFNKKRCNACDNQ